MSEEAATIGGTPTAEAGDGPVERGEASAKQALPSIGVVICSFRCFDFITVCLESVLETGYPRLHIVVADNASDDGSEELVASWAESLGTRLESDAPNTRRWRLPLGAPVEGGDRPEGTRETAELTLIQSGANLGFGGGVNVGLKAAREHDPDAYFWILNPDTIVEKQTPFRFVRKAEEMGRFAVIGGRVLYYEAPDHVQTDGGRLNRFGMTAVSVNRGVPVEKAEMPKAESLAYIPGVSMFVSGDFLEQVGLVPEYWFLYFEEIDWQLRRGDLPLGLEPDARVLHRAGASIGSGSINRPAAPLSVYFTCRNILPFTRCWAPWKLPLAYVTMYYKLLTKWGLRADTITAMLRGLHGFAPPASVRGKLSDDVWQRVRERPAIKK
ncbi:MAG: glycosyltransferase family 2 protein [Pseudomonadota bacterium]